MREKIYKSSDEIKARRCAQRLRRKTLSQSLTPRFASIKQCFTEPLQGEWTRECAARCPLGPERCTRRGRCCVVGICARFGTGRSVFVFAQGATQTRTRRQTPLRLPHASGYRNTPELSRPWCRPFRLVLGRFAKAPALSRLARATQSARAEASGRSAARTARITCAACGVIAGRAGRRCVLRGPFDRRRRRSGPVLGRYSASASLLALLHAVSALPLQSIPCLSSATT
jgi:hypothetical protein